jgi:hypothetical protein
LAVFVNVIYGKISIHIKPRQIFVAVEKAKNGGTTTSKITKYRSKNRKYRGGIAVKFL